MGCLRDIVGVGHVHGDAVVRIHPIGGGTGAAQPQLLLNGKDEVQVVFALHQPLHGHQQHDAGDTVVQIGGEDTAAGTKGGRIIDRGIADLHHRFGLGTISGSNVDIEIVQLTVFGLYLSLQGHHAPDAVFEADGSAQKIRGGEPAQLSKAQKALFVDVCDDKPNGIHMGGKHHPRAAPFLAADQIAQGIHSALIHIGGGQLTELGGHLSFVSRRAVAGVERLQRL